MNKIVLLAILTTTILSAESGKQLFNNYCAHCHTNVLGINESGGEITKIYAAPYAKDVVKKLKSETANEAEFTSFIKSYINNPDKRKSVYGKKAIKDFGLMPSLKGTMNDAEIAKLSHYLYTTYSSENKKQITTNKKSIKHIDPREKIFAKNCAKCHATIIGTNESNGEITPIYTAPYAEKVIKKLKSETANKKEFIAFIKSYINNPDKRKSVYGKKAIKDFGLMPSLKGTLTDKEINDLADYLYQKYN